jgi:DNA replication ATP-dependent helicase Dna2
MRRHERALAAARRGRPQRGAGRAGAAAIATESLALVQGPPGTGKTRLLAQVVAALCGAGCRIAVCAFTHRAVDNALLAIRALAPQLPLFKLDSSSSDDRENCARPACSSPTRAARLPDKGVVVAGTCFQLAKLHDRYRFHYTVFDEAGQLPIPHALPGMLRAQRWLFFGDHAQLPPVVTTRTPTARPRCRSSSTCTKRYGSHLLDTTYRMNDGVCRVVSETFYGGACTRPRRGARRMPFVAGGRLDDVLDPAHAGRVAAPRPPAAGAAFAEEANAVADLVEDLVRRHGVPPAEIAVIAPFRAQVRLLRSAIQHKALAGTERARDRHRRTHPGPGTRGRDGVADRRRPRASRRAAAPSTCR